MTAWSMYFSFLREILTLLWGVPLSMCVYNNVLSIYFPAVPSPMVKDNDLPAILGGNHSALRPELGLLHAHDRDAHVHGEGAQGGLKERKYTLIQ